MSHVFWENMVTTHWSPAPASAPGGVVVKTNSTTAASRGRMHLWAFLIITMSMVLLVITFYLFYRRKLLPIILARRRRRQASTGRTSGGEKIMLRRFEMEELSRATKNFSDECLVGKGAFSNVYKGTFEAEVTLAIKKPLAHSYQSFEDFRNEVMLLSKVKHRNLVCLVGYCEEPGPQGAKILVYEYASNGSLLEHIMGKQGKHLSWRQRVNLAIGAAKGIAHLHEAVKPSIIHRDLKPSNILIGDGFEAKVSDFGLVRSGPREDQSHVSSQIKGTPGYLDPSYCLSFHLTPFSDVYSFGVILLQLIAARPAVDTGKDQRKYHIIDWARPCIEREEVEAILDANLLSEHCNMQVMLKIGQLAMRCVEKSPKQRPTMTQVWQDLEQALHSDRATFVDNESQSFVSVNGVVLRRFHVDTDDLSFQSTSLRCLDTTSIVIDTMDMRGKEEIAESNNHQCI